MNAKNNNINNITVIHLYYTETPNKTVLLTDSRILDIHLPSSLIFHLSQKVAKLKKAAIC